MAHGQKQKVSHSSLTAKRSKAQAAVDAVPAGGTLVLEPHEFGGEIAGPLRIPRAILLDGRNATLWSEQGPVLEICADNVVIRKLTVEFTGPQGGELRNRCSICVRDGIAGTRFDDVVVQGPTMGLPGEEAGWMLPHMLDLGVLSDTASYVMLARVAVPVRCRVVSSIESLRVTDELVGPGLVELRLEIDSGSSHAGALLQGRLALVANGIARRLWVMADVSTGAPCRIAGEHLVWDAFAEAPSDGAPSLIAGGHTEAVEPRNGHGGDWTPGSTVPRVVPGSTNRLLWIGLCLVAPALIILSMALWSGHSTSARERSADAVYAAVRGAIDSGEEGRADAIFDESRERQSVDEVLLRNRVVKDGKAFAVDGSQDDAAARIQSLMRAERCFAFASRLGDVDASRFLAECLARRAKLLMQQGDAAEAASVWSTASLAFSHAGQAYGDAGNATAQGQCERSALTAARESEKLRPAPR